MTDNLPVPAPEPSGEVILYQPEDGITRIEVRLEGDTVWLPQRAHGGTVPDDRTEHKPAPSQAFTRRANWVPRQLLRNT